MQDSRYGTTLDPEFIALVSSEAKGELDEIEAKELRDQEYWDDWGEALTALKRDIENQLTLRKAGLGELQQVCLAAGPSRKQEFFTRKTEHDRWRAGAVRFKSSVEARIAELKKLRRQTKADQDLGGALELLHDAATIIDTTSENGSKWYADYKYYCNEQQTKHGG